MINEVTIVGRVGAIPEIKEIPTGTVTNISVATNRDWKDRKDEWHTETEWHNVVVYGKIGGNAIQKIQVGSLIYVKGRIKTSKWKDQNDVTHKYYDIIAEDIKLLEKPSKSNISESLPSYRSKNEHVRIDENYDEDDPF